MPDLLAQGTVPLVDGAAPIYGLNTIVANVLTVMITLGGIALFITCVLAGFNWITAAGDPKKIEAARMGLTYGIGGMVIMALALLIMKFISDFTGAPIMNFNIYLP